MNGASLVTKHTSLKPLATLQVHENSIPQSENASTLVFPVIQTALRTCRCQRLGFSLQSRDTSLETLGLRVRRLEEFPDLKPPLESLQARYSHTWAYKVSTLTAGVRGTTNPESTPDPQMKSHSGPPPSVLRALPGAGNNRRAREGEIPLEETSRKLWTKAAGYGARGGLTAPRLPGS